MSRLFAALLLCAIPLAANAAGAFDNSFSSEFGDGVVAYAAEANFVIAMKSVNAYATLPRCPEPALCSDPAKVKELTRLADIAQTAVVRDQEAARSPDATAEAKAFAADEAKADITALIEATPK